MLVNPNDGRLAASGECTSKIGHRAVPDRVEDEVVAPPAADDVGRGVVDDVIGAE
jgi:hypothetical protein